MDEFENPISFSEVAHEILGEFWIAEVVQSHKQLGQFDLEIGMAHRILAKFGKERLCCGH